MTLRLEEEHKSGTPWHSIKPRGRRLHVNVWMVYGAGVATYDTTLDGALVLWRHCFLMGQLG